VSAPVAGDATRRAEVLARARALEGWLTDGQAARLWDRAAALRAGARVVEIGSFRGRSMVVLASAAPAGTELVAIDPHAGTDRGPQEIVTTAEIGQSDHEAFLANLDAAGVRDRVRHVRKLSSAAHGDVEDPIDLLYVDGAHRYGPARDDIRDWGARVAPGGTMLVHDSFSSIGVTLALLRLMLAGHDWRYAGRVGSLAEYRRERPAVARNALRQLAELPWFARNLVVKVAIVLRIRPLARLLGHRSDAWPH
jgi:predicted O-methyltransferase YrrM